MTVDIEAEGRLVRVQLHPVEGGWSATIDGRALFASLVPVGSRWSLLVGRSPADPCRSYEVSAEDGRGAPAIRVAGRDVSVRVLATPSPAASRRGLVESAEADGRQYIVTPMPGRVAKVLVVEGQSVDGRQSLVVVEAMKMENEIRAPKAGVVADVRVREGAFVEAQSVLVVME